MESRLRVPVQMESRLSVPVQDGVQTLKSQLRKQKDARKAHGNTQCEHLVTCKYQSVKWNRGYVTHGIEATCASPDGIEAKCARPRWRPNPEIDG